MTARGAGLLDEAELDSLTFVSGIARGSYRRAQLLRPGLLGLAAAGPHMYRKVAA